MTRLLAHSALFFSVFFFPWWMTLIVALVSFFLVEDFYEGIIWGVVADMLYGTAVASLFGFNLVLTILFFILFAFARLLKKKLRLYDQ